MKKSVNLSQKEFERIELYILKKLPEKEQQAFEQELKEKPELQKELEIQKKLMLAVEAGAIRNHLNTIHKKLFGRQKVIRWFAAAASILILISVSIWLINRPSKAERLFAANLTVDPGLPVPMSATDNYVFYDAMVDYKTGKYEEAINKWQPLLNAEPLNDTLNYFIGVAFFNDEKYEQAIPFFEQVRLLNSPAFLGKSEWYMALSFIKIKDFESLKILAEKSQSENAYRIRELNQKLE